MQGGVESETKWGKMFRAFDGIKRVLIEKGRAINMYARMWPYM